MRGGDGGTAFGFLQGDSAFILREAHADVRTTLDLLEAQEEQGLDCAEWLSDARKAGAFTEVPRADLFDPTAGTLASPVTPPEVWGAGVTYRRSAEFREEGSGFYDRVYDAERPELFFKASAGRCAAPGEPIGRRRDSGFTASEPELAIVLGRRGTILGFTLANDVSAWDIERDNPLYLPQSKIYRGCFSFGPVIVTPDEIVDRRKGKGYDLEMIARVNGREFARGNWEAMHWSFAEMIARASRGVDLYPGDVFGSGTVGGGCILEIDPEEAGGWLKPGDTVELEIEGLGVLTNSIA